MAVLEIFSSANHYGKSNYWWKILIFTVLASISAVLAGLSLGYLFLGKSFLGFSSFWGFLIYLCLFAIFFTLESLFAEGARFGAIIVESFLFALSFYAIRIGFQTINGLVLMWSLGVWLLLVLCLWGGRLRMRKRKSDLLRLRWNEMVKGGLALVLIGINLFICLQWMGNAIFQPDRLFTQKTVDAILKPATPLLRFYFTGFDPYMTVNEFIKNIISEQVEAMFVQPEDTKNYIPKNIMDQQKKDLIEQNSIAFRNQLSEWAGFSLSGTESVNTVVFQFLLSKYRALSITTQQYIILGIALLMFVVFRIFAIVVAWVIQMIGWLIYELLLAANFGAVKIEMKNKEDLILY